MVFVYNNIRYRDEMLKGIFIEFTFCYILNMAIFPLTSIKPLGFHYTY